jgi:hypothetical protein
MKREMPLTRWSPELALAYLIHRPEILVAVVLWFSELMAKLAPRLSRKNLLAATKNMYLDTEGNVIEGKVPPHQ